MIIQCENCDTTYTISEAEIGPSGRFVRCTHCAHEWVAYAPIPIATTITPSRSTYYNYEPESKNSLLFYGSILFALVGLLINLALVGMVTIDNGELATSNPLYKVMAPYQSHNLKIHDVSIKIHPSKFPQMQEVGLDIAIYNAGDHPEHLSNVRITAFDKDRQRIAELVSSNPYRVNGKEHQVVHSWIKDVPVATRYISIEFGGALEMFIRPASNLVEGRVI